MTSLRPTRKPVFLWQAGLILLPVLIMATVAITAIIQNRSEVERQARGRAEELATQYGKELEQRLGSFLVQHDIYSDRWAGYLAEVTGGWPGSKRRAQVEAEWHPPPDPPYPGWRAEELFPDRFGLTPDGRFVDGLEFNPAPQPPGWFTTLSPAQRAAWEALNSAAAAAAGPDEIQRRIVAFEVTGPPPPATLNAEFIGLRALLPRQAPAQAVTEALRFAREGVVWTKRYAGADGAVRSVSRPLPSAQELSETLTEAGLPLVNLAFGEALRYARGTGPCEELWNAIPGQVLHAPSPLIPALLDQLQQIAGTNTAPPAGVPHSGAGVPPVIPGAGTNSSLQASVRAWRTLWNARLKLYDIAEAVRQTGKLRGLTTTNFWIEHDQTRWLYVLSPEPVFILRTANDVIVQPTNGLWTAVRFLPKSVVEQALARALETSEVKLPAYLGLAAKLEGEPLSLPERWHPGRGVHPPASILAEATGALSAISKLQQAPGKPDTDYELLPSRPRFVLQLYVADPALLLASYRRQAWLLAGLVAAAAFGALVGVFASWRAFRRQLRLNELKSNFVSSVSHELRAPIASVRLMAESLERGKISEAPKQHEYFRFIVQECRRLSALIENVLDFSRIEQGRKQYDLEPTDLVALTQQTVKLMETYAAERGVKLQLVLPDCAPPEARTVAKSEQGTAPRPLTRPEGTLSSSEGERERERGPSVEPRFKGGVPISQPSLPDYQLPADGKALQQALVNLIDNALKHSPKGDTVTVGLEGGSDQWSVISDQKPENKAAHAPRNTHHATSILLWVEDRGEGIPSSEHEKIFERFYRRGSELRRQTQGVGIGLSIVKHIVEAHGGKVLVRSAPGQGSRFTIELPLNHSEDAKTRRE